jgi:nicotinamidase-related amidase
LTAALLVIDVQKIYTTNGSPLLIEGHAAAIAKINQLAKSFSAKGLPVIYVRHQHKSNGSDQGRMFDYLGSQDPISFVENTSSVEYDPALEIQSPAEHLVKNRYSCFQGTDLERRLKGNAIDTIVVTGFMTNFCCETTARHGHDLDFYVDFIMDATGCPDLSEHAKQDQIKSIVASSLQNGFARVWSTEQYLAEH